MLHGGGIIIGPLDFLMTRGACGSLQSLGSDSNRSPHQSDSSNKGLAPKDIPLHREWCAGAEKVGEIAWTYVQNADSFGVLDFVQHGEHEFLARVVRLRSV
jgi:hypothetical protein